ncbi:RNA-binding S4 domain-containing protein [Actinospongicola halichondriae]|uniref:RNA-binding S4 domain-containing protein n=1 Tax=Actinospongicola halichondriae TaxID=3236844 RepID=UPI003D4D3FEE
MTSSTRIDRWLWAVRVFKTRSLASKGCNGGHVEVNGRSVKPAHKVVVGDRVEARVGDRVRILEVAQIIDKRVGASVAAECFVDHSPPPPEYIRETPQAVRDAGAGRPTKRDRRQLDRYLGRKR